MAFQVPGMTSQLSMAFELQLGAYVGTLEVGALSYLTAQELGFALQNMQVLDHHGARPRWTSPLERTYLVRAVELALNSMG